MSKRLTAWCMCIMASFVLQNLQKGKVSLAEILFGMHMKDTGIKRYPLRTRQRVLQYAVTLVLQKHDPR
jgi:hypothetical protein